MKTSVTLPEEPRMREAITIIHKTREEQHRRSQRYYFYFYGELCKNVAWSPCSLIGFVLQCVRTIP